MLAALGGPIWGGRDPDLTCAGRPSDKLKKKSPWSGLFVLCAWHPAGGVRQRRRGQIGNAGCAATSDQAKGAHSDRPNGIDLLRGAGESRTRSFSSV